MRRPRLFLTGIVLLQALYLMVVGYITRCGVIDWSLFGELLLMGLAVGVVVLPFIYWIHKRKRGRRMPWSTALIFATFLLSVPLEFYFWPHTHSEEAIYRRFLLGLCLYFIMAAPILTFGMKEGENHEPK